MSEVVTSVEIEAAPNSVWQWIASEEALRKWLSPNLEIDLRPGGSYRMLGADGESWISGEVLEVVTESRLVLSWMEEGGGWAHPARLVISLTDLHGATRVDLMHEGFAGIGVERWEAVREAYRRGAASHQVLETLATLVKGTLG